MWQPIYLHAIRQSGNVIFTVTVYLPERFSSPGMQRHTTIRHLTHYVFVYMRIFSQNAQSESTYCPHTITATQITFPVDEHKHNYHVLNIVFQVSICMIATKYKSLIAAYLTQLLNFINLKISVSTWSTDQRQT